MVLGVIEILGHILQFLVFFEVRISPLVEYFVLHSPPAWQFTVIINGSGFGLISQATYSFYLSLIRFFAVYFPLSNKIVQEKCFYISHALTIFLCGTVILCSPIYYGDYIIDKDERMYTENKSTGTYQSRSLFFNRSNRHIYTTTLTGCCTIVAVITNIFTYVKFNKKKSSTFIDSTSQSIQNKNGRNMNLFVMCLTLKQLLFLLFNILQAWKPLLYPNDNSVYFISQGIKPWVMHINFFFSPYAMIYFNKKIRLKIINAILCRKIINNNDTKTAFFNTHHVTSKRQQVKLPQ
uniref:Serpentine receptor class gamma n=1 Tax=Strongyloides venezuelensis TaxID=75913 RepID=A0A0K0FCB9_STRVS